MVAKRGDQNVAPLSWGRVLEGPSAIRTLIQRAESFSVFGLDKIGNLALILWLERDSGVFKWSPVGKEREGPDNVNLHRATHFCQCTNVTCALGNWQ